MNEETNSRQDWGIRLSCSAIHDRVSYCYFDGLFQSRSKGFSHLFFSIKLKFEHKRRLLGDQIAALGRTARFFSADTLHKWVSVCPVCNWWLWISYSTYFTYQLPAFFSAFKATIGSSLCHNRTNHLLCPILHTVQLGCHQHTTHRWC